MKFDPISRRVFLRGLGGLSISLPFMDSLIPKVFAGGEGVSPKNIFMMTYHHGGFRDYPFFGPELGKSVLGETYEVSNTPTLTRQLLIPELDNVTVRYRASNGAIQTATRRVPLHNIHYGLLKNYLSNYADANDPNSGQTRLSAIIGPYLNSLIQDDKISIIRGLDIPHGVGHGRQTFGNINSIQNGHGPRDYLSASPSIDYLIAQSSNFYSNLQGVTHRLTNLAAYNTSYQSNGAGGVEPLPPITSVLSTANVFNALFPNFGQDLGDSTQDINFIDSLMDQYSSLRNSSRIGSEDRHRLDQFMEGLFQVQQSLGGDACILPPSLAASLPDNFPASGSATEGNPNFATYWNQMTSIIALSFLCGRSRVFTANLREDRAIDAFWTGGYHEPVAHRATGRNRPGDDPEAVLQARMNHAGFGREIFRHVFANVVEKLDSVGILNDSLVFAVGEAGNNRTHHGNDHVVLMAGNAGGAFNTGYYVDYRNRLNNAFDRQCSGGPCIPTFTGDFPGRPGILYQQFLANVLRAMNLTPGEYQNQSAFGHGGYGALEYETKILLPQYWQVGNDNTSALGFNPNTLAGWAQDYVEEMASQPLPVISNV